MMEIPILPSPIASWKAPMQLQLSFGKGKHFTASNKPYNIGTISLIFSFAFKCSQSFCLTTTIITTPIVYWQCYTLTKSWCCTRKTIQKLQLNLPHCSQKPSRSVILITHSHFWVLKLAKSNMILAQPLARMPSSPYISHHSIYCILSFYQLWWIIMWSLIWPRIGGRQNYKMSMATGQLSAAWCVWHLDLGVILYSQLVLFADALPTRLSVISLPPTVIFFISNLPLISKCTPAAITAIHNTLHMETPIGPMMVATANMWVVMCFISIWSCLLTVKDGRSHYHCNSWTVIYRFFKKFLLCELDAPAPPRYLLAICIPTPDKL